MRVSNMMKREQFYQIFSETLAEGWQAQHGMRCAISQAGGSAGDAWYLNPLLNACFPSDMSGKARQFLFDRFAYTDAPSRKFAQLCLGGLLTTRLGLYLASRRLFTMEARLPFQNETLIIPCNQRIRIFNFQQNICRVFLKKGFDSHTMRREIEVRGMMPEGPFPRIVKWDDDGGWFDEPIIDGYPLPRVPPSYRKRDIEKQSFTLLDQWLSTHESRTVAGTHVQGLVVAIRDLCRVIQKKFPFGRETKQIADITSRLEKHASNLEEIPVSVTHGDFQAGNIHVEKGSHKPYLSDWEHSAQRSRDYDFLVFGLRTRSPHGLAKRVDAYLAGSFGEQALDFVTAGDGDRIVALAVFFLEDLKWNLQENTTGPYIALTEGLNEYLRQLDEIIGNTFP